MLIFLFLIFILISVAYDLKTLIQIKDEKKYFLKKENWIVFRQKFFFFELCLN